MPSMPETIARIARSRKHGCQWAYATEKGPVKANTHKCNQFVFDVLEEAGVWPPPQVPGRYGRMRMPTAGEWANPVIVIPGWKVVKDAQPGDVIAEWANYSDATGHMGIVVGPNETASATATVVVVNDWGFRTNCDREHPTGCKPTFRRFDPASK